jgi:hypothetical protein
VFETIFIFDNSDDFETLGKLLLARATYKLIYAK